MDIKLCDRVKQTTTSAGDSGDWDLIPTTEPNMLNFGDCLADGDMVPFCRVSSTDFELGIGVLDNGGTTISRVQIIRSSDGGNPINWTTEECDIFCTIPAAFIPRMRGGNPAVDDNPGIVGTMVVNIISGEIFVFVVGDNGFEWRGTNGTVIEVENSGGVILT